MRAEEFVAGRRDDWNQLENLIARGGSGRLNPLQPMQVLTLAALYRRATADAYPGVMVRVPGVRTVS